MKIQVNKPIFSERNVNKLNGQNVYNPKFGGHRRKAI